MRMKDSDSSFTRREEKRLIEAAAGILRTDFQQPDRTRCPCSHDVKALALRRRDLADATDLVDHIGTCSPCFVEYSQYRSTHKHRLRIVYGLASVAAVVVIAFLAWLPARSPDFKRRQPGTEVARTEESRKSPVQLVLDLTNRGRARSDVPAPSRVDAEMHLPRTALSLIIHLPVGSEDGVYEVAVMKSSGQPVIAVKGEAALKNFVEVLPVALDLTSLAPGPYQLGIRRPRSEWRTYPILLKQ